jgi:hypothetical protein
MVRIFRCASGFHHSVLFPNHPPHIIPHDLVSGIVAACLDIQVRIMYSCLSAIKINAYIII